MADTFAMARFRAQLLRREVLAPQPAKPVTPTAQEVAELRVDILMRAVTMAEIAEAAQLLGLTFKEAYQQRARLYRRSPLEWVQVKR